MGELLRRYWQPVCTSDELSDLSKKVKLHCCAPTKLPVGIGEDVASRAGESHPHALPEPYVSLSAHTAPDVRPPTYSRRQWTKRAGWARTTRANQSRAPAVRARSRLYL